MLPILLASLPLVLGAADPPVASAPVTPPSAATTLRRRAATWPVEPAEVTAGFDPPAARWQSGHRGIDLRASAGTPVRSAAAGTVTFADDLAGRGVVVVSHGAVRTTYEPLVPSVRVGDQVGAGDLLGAVGEGTGHCGDAGCLHWGLRRGDRYLDPRLLLGIRPVLKPVR